MAIALAILIGFHEFGHFVAARLTGVRVLRFSIGFGPRIIAKKIGETDYALSLIPLGGYVKMAGEDSSAFEGGKEESDFSKEETFAGRPIWQRWLIVFAGPGFNLLLAFLAFSFTSLFYGESVLTNVVGGAVAGSPAAKASIISGDEIIDICENPNRLGCTAVSKWSEIQDRVQKAKNDATLHFVVKRGGNILIKPVDPVLAMTRNVFGEEAKIFVVGLQPAPPVRIYNRLGFLKTALRNTYNDTVLILVSVKKMLTGAVSAKDIGGPVIIGKIAGDAWQSGGLEIFLYFLALMSVNLGVLNLFPIPVLDGGYLWIFLPYEAIKGRPMSAGLRERLNSIGLILLLALMLFALKNDITRLAG